MSRSKATQPPGQCRDKKEHWWQFSSASPFVSLFLFPLQLMLMREIDGVEHLFAEDSGKGLNHIINTDSNAKLPVLCWLLVDATTNWKSLVLVRLVVEEC